MFKISLVKFKIPLFSSKRNSTTIYMHEGVRIVNHCGNIKDKLTKTINAGIDSIKLSGYSLPDSIFVEKDSFLKKDRKYTGLFDEYFKHDFFINPRWNCKNKKRWSTRTREHPLFHENIHRLHYAKNPEKAMSEETLNNDELRLAKKYVSKYAVKKLNGKRQEIGEFIAEVGAGLTAGKQYPEKIMAIYKKYDGPMPNKQRIVLLA